VQLFNQGFSHGLVEGLDARTAFGLGSDRVRLDDIAGEVAWPDGMEDLAPSPHKRLQ